MTFKKFRKKIIAKLHSPRISHLRALKLVADNEQFIRQRWEQFVVPQPVAQFRDSRGCVVEVAGAIAKAA